VEAENNLKVPEAPAPAPLQIPAQTAARLAGVSLATWWRLHSAQKVPAPTRLGGRTLWNARELAAWIEAKCPDRKTWEALKANGRK